MPYQLSFRRSPGTETADLDIPGDNGEYILVDSRTGAQSELWRSWPWVDNIDNYVDPDFQVFVDEHDFDLIDKKGSLCSYKTHILGNSRLPHKKTVHPKPYTFWLFCQGVAYMLNNPKTWRTTHKDRFYGGLVVNYVNTVPIEDLLPPHLNLDYYEGPIFNAVEKNRNILPPKYGALYARTFNDTVGINLPFNHKLKVEERKSKITKCPCCEALVYHPRGNWVEVTDPDYPEALEAYESQYQKKGKKDTTGEN